MDAAASHLLFYGFQTLDYSCFVVRELTPCPLNHESHNTGNAKGSENDEIRGQAIGSECQNVPSTPFFGHLHSRGARIDARLPGPSNLCYKTRQEKLPSPCSTAQPELPFSTLIQAGVAKTETRTRNLDLDRNGRIVN